MKLSKHKLRQVESGKYADLE